MRCISVPPVTTLLLHIVKKKIHKPKKHVSTQKSPLFISVLHSYEGEPKKLIGQGSWSAASLQINTMHLEPRKATCERAMIMEQDFYLAQLWYKKNKTRIKNFKINWKKKNIFTKSNNYSCCFSKINTNLVQVEGGMINALKSATECLDTV